MLPILVIALCFVELSDVTDCTEGAAKKMKILKMIGESSTTIILPILAVKELRSCRPVECIIGFLRYPDIHTS